MANPGETGGGNIDVNAMLAQATAEMGILGGAEKDPNIVPLWQTRPGPATTRPSSAGRNRDRGRGAEGLQHGGVTTPAQNRTTGPSWFVDKSASPGVGVLTEPPRQAPTYYTPQYAETAWMDMSPEERAAFAKKLQAAGMWDPKDGPDKLVGLWTSMVRASADYNQSRDKDKWISPWEAVDKLYGANAGAAGATADEPYGGWRTSTDKRYTTFTEDQLRTTAEQILQRELGRNPTDAELKAYTIAANKAAKDAPQTVTTKSRDTEWDAQGRPINQESSQTVEGQPYDPTGAITDEVRDSEEGKKYRSATSYYNWMIDALSSPV